MKKLIFTAFLLFTLSVNFYSQNIENVFSAFIGEECIKFDDISEKEWKYAKYIFSKIDPPFYDMDREIQIKDSINSFWFDKVFTRKEGNSYSLDFNKVKKEAAKVDDSNIPEVKEFIFIGMKIPMLEKAKSITSLEMNNCSDDLKNKFWKEFESIKSSYETLVSRGENNEKNLIMKNKGDSFSEIIVLSQSNESSTNLMWLKGTFDITDITPPKDYNEND